VVGDELLGDKSISNPVASGVGRALKGLRTGDQRSLLTGAALIAFGLWRRSRERETRKLVYRKVLTPGQAILIRRSTHGAQKFVVSEDFAADAKGKSRKGSS
jgi:hypothetical protein